MNRNLAQCAVPERAQTGACRLPGSGVLGEHQNQDVHTRPRQAAFPVRWGAVPGIAHNRGASRGALGEILGETIQRFRRNAKGGQTGVSESDVDAGIRLPVPWRAARDRQAAYDAARVDRLFHAQDEKPQRVHAVTSQDQPLDVSEWDVRHQLC